MADRQEWLSLLATSDPQILAVLWADTGLAPDYVILRKAETGSVMVRGRAGSVGKAFNFGEMTMTKCIVELEAGTEGHAYIAGSDAAHAEMAAVMDALLQEKDSRDRIMSDIIIPLQQDLRDRKQKTQSKVAATRVDFFTLVRGEDE